MAGRTTSYTYDGRGLRIAASTNGTTTGYLRDADGVYGLLDGAGAVTRYLIGTGQLLYSIGTAAGDVLVYHGDERGSVVAVTDGTGQEVQSYLYGPYGEVLAAQGTLPNPFQYLGQHWVMTDANGLLHMNARYYLPEARRFLTEDPIGLGGGPNVLAYAAGDPVNQIDPSGLDFVIPPGWHPEVAKAAEKFVTKGIELGLRELGYFHPTGGVVVDGIKISTTEWAEYTALNANQLMRQNSLDYTAHWGQTGGTPSNPVKGYQFKPRLPQAPVKGYQFKPRLPQAPVKGYQFKPRLPQAPVKGYQFKPRLPQASVPKPPGGPKVPTGLLGRVGRWAGPVGMVIAAGLEGWHTGRKLGQSSLVWDGNQGRWITLDEGHQWIYNQYNGWVDQPEMFDYIDPVAYANWKSKAFGDGTGGGTKGDGTSLPGVGSGGAR
jgi:RHS repeat-associated protein